MDKHFPLRFTLENGTEVTVNEAGDHYYDFTLKPKNKAESRFGYRADQIFTEEMENTLTFDQLNALRRFWLEREKE